VVVIATGTLWILFSMWLVFRYLDMPRMLCGAAGTLMWIEFTTLTVWGFASENCDQRPCSVLSETTRAAAGIDLPVLSVVVLVLAGAELARSAHRGPKTRNRTDAPRRDVTAVAADDDRRA
jgi:hypothetical protein